MKERSLFNNEKGLYNFSYEHDACGVGMLVNIHGGKSHEIVESALKVLENMQHRGAEGKVRNRTSFLTEGKQITGCNS